MTLATTPGLSGGRTNRALFAAGRLRDIDWITVRGGAVTLGQITAEPAPAGVKFGAAFSADELLAIARAQMPYARSFLGLDVVIDGVTPAAIGPWLSGHCRQARSLSINIPQEGRVQEVWRREPHCGELVPGDKVRWADAPGRAFTVCNVGERAVNLRRDGGSGRGGATVWCDFAEVDWAP